MFVTCFEMPRDATDDPAMKRTTISATSSSAVATTTPRPAPTVALGRLRAITTPSTSSTSPIQGSTAESPTKSW